MKISVAIAAYNAAEYLREAIESVLAQTLPPYEIVVVDDGSSDHTAEVCRSFGERVRYFYRENDGTAGIGARWQSINESKGDWIALLDHDDRWLPKKLERQYEAVKTFPGTGVVFTKFRNIDDYGNPLDPTSEPAATGEIRQYNSHDALHHLLRSNPYCPSSAMVLRRALIDDGPPSSTSCGDWSDWLRITRRYPMTVVDEYLTEYRVTAEQFCANKDLLARRMRETLMAQRPHLFARCPECRLAFREGRAHVAQVFSVAARAYLDQYHEAVRSADTASARRLMSQVIRTAPFEVLRPRRLAAASRSYVRAILKKDSNGN
jgi:glycosyltransferase involved in cell wall biosynthesis